MHWTGKSTERNRALLNKVQTTENLRYRTLNIDNCAQNVVDVITRTKYVSTPESLWVEITPNKGSMIWVNVKTEVD